MARNQIRGNEQIMPQTFDRGRLILDFLAGSDLDLTNGNNDATITGLSAGVNPNDAVNKAQLDAALAALIGGSLESVATLSVSNELLTGVGQTINGHTVVAGDRIAIVEQTTVTEDGIYVAGAGAWVRSGDAQIGTDLAGKIFVVEQGTEADTLWVFTNDDGSGIVGTDDLEVIKVSESTPAQPTDVYDEEPAVTNGSPVVTLANTPIASTHRVYLNGQRMREGVGNDFTIAGAVITFEYNLKNNPGNPDHVQVDYKHS
jgi:hypothetical protein